jgi:hypothetical protein
MPQAAATPRPPLFRPVHRPATAGGAAPLPQPAARPQQSVPGWVDLRQMEHLLGSCRRQGRLAAMLLIELQPADPDSAAALVQSVGQRLRCRVRGNDPVSQIDPGSLAVLLLDAGELASNGARERLCELLRAPYRLGTELRRPLLRIGRAVHGLDGQHAADLLQAARLVTR